MEFLKAGIRALAEGAREAARPLALGDFAIDASGGGRDLVGTFDVTLPVAFAPRIDMHVSVAGGNYQLSSNAGAYLHWLPRGRYAFRARLPAAIPAGTAQVTLVAAHYRHMADEAADRRTVEASIGADASGAQESQWSFESIAPTVPIDSLAWRKGYSNWFFRHFDHAATTLISYMFADSPLLRRRVLDIGCGDGITDLGFALRTGSEKFVGIDPFRQFERLPQIVADHHLPPDIVPPWLSFLPEDANFLPFEDDSFEVVISWGSLEHMAGGYLQALREVKRVLVPDGLFFAGPGLYYSSIGHHLDEFSDEPHFHLKKSPEEVRRIVMETPPRYIDRSGEFSSNEQFWKWHTELNRITVTQFEKEMRALEFEPWRVALRTTPLVEYTPELQPYSIEQLANVELYSSWYNRKRRRP